MMGHTDESPIAVRTAELRRNVDTAVAAARVVDLHTHLYPPQFGKLSLWGIDELLTYHYLIAEMFRFSDLPHADFWKLEKSEQADAIWKTLFVDNTPLSEATRGVVHVLSSLGLDTRMPDLGPAREYFRSISADEYVEMVLSKSGVSDIVMTNDPLDTDESQIWQNGIELDTRFHTALRIDRFLNNWAGSVDAIAAQGYGVDRNLGTSSITAMRRFAADWIGRISPLYLGVSLPNDFRYPDSGERSVLLKDVILPACREHDLPLALMIGVRRHVNPMLRLAGDGVGLGDVSSVTRICAENPDVKFLVTFLARENQHELCVAARKFNNMLPFGCWWFLNNPSIIAEITRERLEMLGTSFVAQHSDARILDQLIYKWEHSRQVIAGALFESYERLLADGRDVRADEIERDVNNLFSGNFRKWVGLP